MGTNDDLRHHEDLHHAVAEAMAKIAAGDQSAIWELHPLAAPAVRGMLRREARRVSAWISDDDLHELTLDAAMLLGGMARSWKPGGALPWVWARLRILGLVHQHLGMFTRELDERHDEIAELPIVIHLDEPRAVLRSLAARHEGAAALDRRLTEAANDRDAEIYLGYQIEKAAGNRSPAVTVAADHGMQPAAVRKVVQRVSQRLAVEQIGAERPVEHVAA